jgi:hypothetical protein
MRQSRLMSLVEAIANVIVALIVAVATLYCVAGCAGEAELFDSYR